MSEGSTKAPDALNFSEVVTFLRVVEMGSFTAAARLLGASKAKVSRKVTQLETRLGARLLQRTTRSLSLTEAGQTYYDRAKDALTQLEDAGEQVQSLQREPTGHLRVTAPVDMGQLLARLTAAFCEAFPKISVEAFLTQRRVDLIGEGIDIALRAGGITDSRLIARKLAYGETYLYASADYLDQHGVPQSVEELDQHPLILFRAPHGRQRLSLKTSGGTSVTYEARARVSADDFTFIRNLVLAGSGIGFLPALSAAPHVTSGALRAVLPNLSIGGGQLCLVYPSASYMPAKVKAFRDFVLERKNTLLNLDER